MRFRTARGAGSAIQRATPSTDGIMLTDYAASSRPVALTTDGWRATVIRTPSVSFSTGAGLDVFTVEDVPAGSEWVFQIWGMAERTALGGGSYLQGDLRGRNGAAVSSVFAAQVSATNSGSAFGGTALEYSEPTNAIGARVMVVGVISCIVTADGDLALNFTGTTAAGTWRFLAGLHVEAMRID